MDSSRHDTPKSSERWTLPGSVEEVTATRLRSLEAASSSSCPPCSAGRRLEVHAENSCPSEAAALRAAALSYEAVCTVSLPMITDLVPSAEMAMRRVRCWVRRQVMPVSLLIHTYPSPRRVSVGRTATAPTIWPSALDAIDCQPALGSETTMAQVAPPSVLRQSASRCAFVPEANAKVPLASVQTARHFTCIPSYPEAA